MGELNIVSGMSERDFAGWASLARTADTAPMGAEEQAGEHEVQEVPAELRSDLIATLRDGAVVQRTYEAAKKREESARNPISRYFAKRARIKAQPAVEQNNAQITALSSRLVPVQAESVES